MVKCSTKIQRLQHQIDTQELSIHDVEYMSTEHARLTSQVSAANTRKESVLENKRNITHAITQVLSELEMALVDYSTIAHRLKLLPLGAKHALDQNFEVRLDTAASNASNTAILTADLKTHIRVRILKSFVVNSFFANLFIACTFGIKKESNDSDECGIRCESGNSSAL